MGTVPAAVFAGTDSALADCMAEVGVRLHAVDLSDQVAEPLFFSLFSSPLLSSPLPFLSRT